MSKNISKIAKEIIAMPGIGRWDVSSQERALIYIQREDFKDPSRFNNLIDTLGLSTGLSEKIQEHKNHFKETPAIDLDDYGELIIQVSNSKMIRN